MHLEKDAQRTLPDPAITAWRFFTIMDEIVFLREGGVTVTNNRLIVLSQSYRLQQIIAISSFVEKPSRLAPILTILTGVMLATKSPIALVLLVVGVIWWVIDTPRYHLEVEYTHGEKKILCSENRHWIGRIMHALNAAKKHNL
jgi:hypothetical protein